jgi:hypothetical protein
MFRSEQQMQLFFCSYVPTRLPPDLASLAAALASSNGGKAMQHN